MTTMSGQGACPNAGPVARLQAELEGVEGQLDWANAEIAALRAALEAAGTPEPDARLLNWAIDAELTINILRRERDAARALVSDSLVCW